MLFNSYLFLLIFLPVVLATFYGLARARLTTAALGWLVLASLVFYATGNYSFLPILLFSIAFNYQVGRTLAASPTRPLLLFGLAVNLGVLGYYKYANFFIDNLNALVGGAVAPLNVVLPLGLSFITVQKIAFLVDSYRGTARAYRFSDFLLFVTFFPQLISGPITHHHAIITQLQRKRLFVLQPANLARGAFFFSVGLFKKVVIADPLALWVAPAYHLAQPLSCVEAWGAMLAFTFQIYFDFSGYSEMALGLGLLFNLRLPVNFLSPYQAVSVSDYWRRWHISLSAWFGEYVFTPLAFAWKRHRKPGIVAASLVTFLLSGLWHGAGWTFVLFGLVHGLAVSFDAVTAKSRRRLESRVPRKAFAACAMVATFLYVALAQVLFRANDFATAQHVFGALAGQGEAGMHPVVTAAVGLSHRAQGAVLALLYAWVVFTPNTVAWAERLRPTWPWVLWTALLFVTAVLRLDHPTAFIYYHF